MTIECGECESSSWCIWDDGGWICKNCYEEQGNDDWDEMNEEAKRRREERRMGIASEEYSDFSPASYTPKPKLCKYGCGKPLIWDNTLETKNKFIEADSPEKRPHSYMRCADLLKKQGKTLKK